MRRTAQTLSASGALTREVAPRAQHLARLRERIDDQAGVHLGADRMEQELERGDDAEVAAAAAQRPEQVGLGVARDDVARAVGGDDGRAAQVVDRHAVAARQPAEAAAEREAGDAGGRVDAERRRQAVRLRLAIEVGEQRAGADARGAARRVDADRVHRRQVEQQAALGDRVAGDVVAAAANAEQHALLGGEADAGADVVLVAAARDQGRTAVDGAVPDLARVVVARVAGSEDAAADPARERLDIGLTHLPDILVQRKVG